jgi:hypothetical protein
MPHWMLSCRNCEQQFPHSEIPKEMASPLSGPFGFLIEKPLFPEQGLEVECPHCGKTSIYQRHQLTLRTD